MERNSYESPLGSRYASKRMQEIFSPDRKFKTWRRLWIALARAESELGLPITDEQIAEMESQVDNINYKEANERERLVRHDVMAHVYAYGLQCPKAKGIIHLGATSCYVGDNTDIILMREGLFLIRQKLIGVLSLLADFADKYKTMPTLAYTHLQPAQLTTVGKRASLWLYDFWMDMQELDARIASLKLLGSKGTTGTQASFLKLFDGDSKKVKLLEEKIAKEMGFEAVVPVSGQTYSRKVDYQVLSVLSSIAQSAMKFSGDVRILQSFKEMEEPFNKKQIGSSAMPYKRNPMRCERITALSRYVIADCLNPALTAGAQWMERTLDDSANKRLSVAEAFLSVDGILDILLDVCNGIEVYPKVIARRVYAELPFMATENILMEAVKRGGDRQKLHERLREHSIAAAAVVKKDGGENDLILRIADDTEFGLSLSELKALLKPENFIGRCKEQVEEFLEDDIRPFLNQNSEYCLTETELKV